MFEGVANSQVHGRAPTSGHLFKPARGDPPGLTNPFENGRLDGLSWAGNLCFRCKRGVLLVGTQPPPWVYALPQPCSQRGCPAAGGWRDTQGTRIKPAVIRKSMSYHQAQLAESRVAGPREMKRALDPGTPGVVPWCTHLPPACCRCRRAHVPATHPAPSHLCCSQAWLRQRRARGHLRLCLPTPGPLGSAETITPCV